MYHVLLIMLILIGLGIVLQIFKIFPPGTASLLNKFVLYISFPCLVFRSLQPATIEAAYWKIPPLALSIITIIFLLSYGWGKYRLKFSPASSASFAMGAAFGNTAFLGYPFVIALLGENALPPAIFFDQMGNFLVVYTVGVAICAYSKDQKFSFTSFKEILKLPPFLAFIVALLLNGVSIPAVFMDSIKRLADTTVPVIMIAIGLSLSIKHLSRRLVPILYATGIKLVLLPILFLILTRFILFEPVTRQVMVIQSATPTLMSSFALASLYSLDTELCSSIIFTTTIISFATLPLWNFILHYF